MMTMDDDGMDDDGMDDDGMDDDGMDDDGLDDDGTDDDRIIYNLSDQFLEEKKTGYGPTNGRTDQRTNGWTRALIEMRGRI